MVASEDSLLFPVQIMRGKAESDLFAVKAGVEKQRGLVGFKFGGYWPGNAQSGLPPHSSTTVLLDGGTGYPRALPSGRIVNLYRTAAADAVAVGCLARKDATVLGVIGGGHQAEYEIRAIAHVRDLRLIKVFTRSRERGEWISRQLADLGIEIRLTDAEGAVRGSDIVVTVTPSRDPIVRSKDIAADAVCPIGRVTSGNAVGRESACDVTTFDSSGIAIQDLAIAAAVFDRARELGLGTRIDFWLSPGCDPAGLQPVFS
ncbi:MAG: ornithine cyclodeaminase family protein [Gammaproteobacteria bacterium]